jgi:hypothetical protein
MMNKTKANDENGDFQRSLFFSFGVFHLFDDQLIAGDRQDFDGRPGRDFRFVVLGDRGPADVIDLAHPLMQEIDLLDRSPFLPFISSILLFMMSRRRYLCTKRPEAEERGDRDRHEDDELNPPAHAGDEADDESDQGSRGEPNAHKIGPDRLDGEGERRRARAKSIHIQTSKSILVKPPSPF